MLRRDSVVFTGIVDFELYAFNKSESLTVEEKIEPGKVDGVHPHDGPLPERGNFNNLFQFPEDKNQFQFGQHS